MVKQGDIFGDGVNVAARLEGLEQLVKNIAHPDRLAALHSRLVESLRPDNPLAQAPYLAQPFSLSTPSGVAALNAEVALHRFC